MRCNATILIDFDSIVCVRPQGHEGMHEDDGEFAFYWTFKR